jgi:hypothetical protein
VTKDHRVSYRRGVQGWRWTSWEAVDICRYVAAECAFIRHEYPHLITVFDATARQIPR